MIGYRSDSSYISSPVRWTSTLSICLDDATGPDAPVNIARSSFNQRSDADCPGISVTTVDRVPVSRFIGPTNGSVTTVYVANSRT